MTSVWHRGERSQFQLIDRRTLRESEVIPGGSIVVSDQSTLIVEPNWKGTVDGDGAIVLSPNVPLDGNAIEPTGSDPGIEEDPVMLEIVARRFQSIADSMGEVLRRTAVSVNVKERLDFSCAVFRGDGTLIANAPHCTGAPWRDGPHRQSVVRAISKNVPW